ncbi:MAG: hypothetical protein RR221_06880 [Alistipes sp.]
MRTIDDIKENICVEYMRSDAAAAAYGFTVGDNFSTHFSKVSVESVLFYVVAVAIWVLENLFESHKKETEELIDGLTPHRPKWYRDKVLAFMAGHTLIADTDRYDTANMSNADIETARVVKHAVAVENNDSSILTIKVAGENGGVRCKLDVNTQTQLSAYIAEIKDAGVRVALVNTDPDTFNCKVDVYYDPTLLPADVETGCRQVIKNYVENLPFNGEYTNMALVDDLQKVEGVKIAELQTATTSIAADTTVTAINARTVPKAGYFTIGIITINMIAHNG